MKKSLFCLVSIFTLLLPVDFFALSGDVAVNCNTTSVKVGEQVKCSVSGSSDGQISRVFANISASGSISIDKFRAERIWDVKTEWPNLLLESKDKKPGNFEIGTVYLKANSAGTGNFVMSGITFTDDDGTTVSVSNKSIAISIISDNPTPTPTPEPTPEPAPVVKSNDSSLKSLTVSSGSIEFSPSVLEYSLDVSSNVTQIEFQAVPNDSKASVKLPDNLSLETGNNEFSILVTAEDGSTTTYKINVNRLETILSENALLSSLSISGYNIDFSSDVFEYKLGDITTNTLNITATAIDSNSKVKIYGNNNIGKDGVIIIRVTSEAGNSKDYILYVNNTNASSNDSSSSLSNDLMLIISSSLFVISAIVIVILLAGRNKYKKKLQKEMEKQLELQLADERKKLELLAVELQNKLAMIPQTQEEEKPVPLEEITKEQIDEEIDSDILEKRKEEEKKTEDDPNKDAEKIDDVEEVIEEKSEEVKEEKKIGEDARDILPPEVSELVNSKSEEVVVQEEKKEEPTGITEISAESVADVVKKKPKEDEIKDDDKKDNKKKRKKKK